MKPSEPNESPWRGAVLVSAVTTDFIVCLGAGYWLGSYWDRRNGEGELWSIIGLGIGVIVAAVSIFFIIRRFTEDNGRNG